MAIKEIMSWKRSGIIDHITQILQKNKIIISSTDTVLGLLAPVTEEGYKALGLIKQRMDKPYLILIGTSGSIFEFIEPFSNIQIENLINYCWPGPLTLVFKAKAMVPSFVRSEQGTVALRVPNHEGLQVLATRFHGLFSTSANITGQPVPFKCTEVDSTILDAVEACIDDSLDELCNVSSQASTILDCSTSTIRVVRVGAYSIDRLEKIAGVQFS